jgi:hypothetical protein
LQTRLTGIKLRAAVVDTQEAPLIFNVIDQRKQPYRWAKVHAVMEATWHDNSCDDADQAPGLNIANEVTFEERWDVTVKDAIEWANAEECAVTLYLFDGVKLAPQSDVEAATKVLDRFGRTLGWWPKDRPPLEKLGLDRQHQLKHVVEAMLVAASDARR